MTYLQLSPKGRLHFEPVSEGTEADPWLQKAEKAFSKSPAAGLFMLGANEPTGTLTSDLSYWRGFSRSFLTEVCRTPEGEDQIASIPALQDSELATLLLSAPPMNGGEYLSTDILASLWHEMAQWLSGEIEATGLGYRNWFQKHAKSWNEVGKVCFHLAENKTDPDFPFAFLATFSPELSNSGRVQYKPLGQALQMYAGEKDKKALTQLLTPVQRAAEKAEFVRDMVDSGDVFHPLAWSPTEAYEFLRHAGLLEDSGVVLRLPNWWKKRPRPRVSVSIGNNKKQKLFNADSLLDFKVDVALGDQKLTKADLKKILAAEDGLVFIKGQWVEVDKKKLTEVLDQWKAVEAEAGDGMSFIEGMRMLSGASSDLGGASAEELESEWAHIYAGDWLGDVLQDLRRPEDMKMAGKVTGFNGVLRPYQEVGFQWLRLLSGLGLGACLADDMGLGKTVQIISFLQSLHNDQKKTKTQVPSLLVLPASLLANWKGELEKFAPKLKVAFVHPSMADKKSLDTLGKYLVGEKAKLDVVLTTYGMLSRHEWMAEVPWQTVILDEAQAIKNPNTSQTKAVKALQAKSRIALTGTPVENRLSDLWSLYDFICPGLLGSTTKFKKFVKALESRSADQYAPLRQLVAPYILRRLKTDKTIISDLPDKTEVKAYCGLTKKQGALYTKAVKKLEKTLTEADGIQRRGAVLASLIAFKQICNHPSQFTADGVYDQKHSGKFAKLIALCEEIASRQEKVLIFTQFREMTGPIADTLAEVFGREGLVLHGGTPVKKRQKLVRDFQSDDGPPFFVLSLKAGGTGLTLTAASHVIHFDRWWNPAVENQATDRAFRIGQKNNVMVHKFVCQGTMEEKIDALLEAKSDLADDLLQQSGDSMLTEMSNDELLDIVTLNVDRATI